MDRQTQIQQIVVTTKQMQAIEARVFAAGMPVAALMEKVAGLMVRRIQTLYPVPGLRVGILVGPGHNGGDALVIARELYFRGAIASIYCPFPKLKELTSTHAAYAKSLGIVFTECIEHCLEKSDLIIDGLFGFGLERPIADPIAAVINQVNQSGKPIFSIDLPSGLHADTGEVLGTAICATRTFCLGLWKLGLLQDQALAYIGTAELIDFDLPLADIWAVVGHPPMIQRVTTATAIAHLPLTRPPVTHKYKMGHLLLICGSRRYLGAAIITALGARASGVGMLSIAVPESLKSLLVTQVPEALIIGCTETETGAIAQLPADLDLNAYHAIGCGPGLTLAAAPVVKIILASDRTLVLDADALNILANFHLISALRDRQGTTILTPHAGEFQRLFPELDILTKDRIDAVKSAAQQSGAIILLKGARTAIANPTGSVWIIPTSTPALARGGSGDALTGLLAGLITQTAREIMVPIAAWWHAQAGRLAAQERTELGVDALTLTQYLLPALHKILLLEPSCDDC